MKVVTRGTMFNITSNWREVRMRDYVEVGKDVPQTSQTNQKHCLFRKDTCGHTSEISSI